jgi:hypothetical protein
MQVRPTNAGLLEAPISKNLGGATGMDASTTAVPESAFFSSEIATLLRSLMITVWGPSQRMLPDARSWAKLQS